MHKQNRTVKFLYEASKLLPSNDLYTAIRSRMVSKYCYINASNSLNLDLSPRCDACGVLFKDVPPVNYIKPVPKPNCYKKILNSKQNSKYQIESLKKYLKYKNDKQILVTQCKLCKIETKTLLNKHGHVRNNKAVQNVPILKKKKQKKKNKEFSGLKKDAVLSVKKRSLEENELSSPKRMKTNSDIIDLVSPASNILTANKMKCPNTPEIICLDSPKKQPKKSKSNESVIEISDSDASSVSPQKSKKKKNKKPPVVQKPVTPKLKNNNNVVLVSEHNTAEKKQKKLNNLSTFLKKSQNTSTPKKSSSLLENFLNTFT